MNFATACFVASVQFQYTTDCSDWEQSKTIRKVLFTKPDTKNLTLQKIVDGTTGPSNMSHLIYQGIDDKC